VDAPHPGNKLRDRVIADVSNEARQQGERDDPREDAAHPQIEFVTHCLPSRGRGLCRHRARGEAVGEMRIGPAHRERSEREREADVRRREAVGRRGGTSGLEIEGCGGEEQRIHQRQ
jgi:hypothetical protein